ncbi:hypothetical protein N658DRAFT_543529 [Parathielavia hyrcaniae]|uniref:Uncharacterized protein n=1 Tax=Parathielavia hyrcaniae TaxID=113614 RepID=A0AAN6PVC1_9PEZI|nr:hypothetical protein N658DRAFT_543529 [Parathielavia hyrcaniae]
MGGTVFDERAQVLWSELGGELRPIQWQREAGRTRGGISGDKNLGRSSMLERVLFGRITGGQPRRLRPLMLTGMRG